MDNNSKQLAFDWIEKNRQNLSNWHQIIWHLAEPAWREYKSCAWFGFQIIKDALFYPGVRFFLSPRNARAGRGQYRYAWILCR